MRRKPPPAPEHLTGSKAYWDDVTAEFDFESHHLQILRRVCEAMDEADDCLAVIREQGRTYLDRFGQPKERPEASGYDKAVIRQLRAQRELALDVAAEESRPPAIGHDVRIRA